MSLKAPAMAPDKRASPLLRAERADHEHVRRLALGLIATPPEQVPPVGRPERPWQLDLGEGKQWRDRDRPPGRR